MDHTMNKSTNFQRIRLGNKQTHVGRSSSFAQNSDGFVTFAVGDRYKLLEAIGTGAYGIVCSAIDTKTNQHVAIKKIVNPFEVLTTAKRTLRELKLLLHFNHDNVVGIRNIVQSNEQSLTDVYLVMDLMESDLHHIIRSEQSLSAEHICYFLYQLLRGLKYIHSANVIHRDLKPSNLLVNETCELKIGDFGMARAVSSSLQDHKMFMTEYVATRWYRAPELMLSVGEYSQAIDMWSVGCIFAEMMGRKQIFPGRHYVHQLQLVISVLGSPARELVKSIRSDRVRAYVSNLPHRDPVKLNSLYPKASEQMLDLLQSFLQFDPAKRPPAEESLNHPFFSTYHDVDDEPVCPHPFDFRFESTVTKKEVYDQVAQVIDGYQNRKSRFSQQLMAVKGNKNVITFNDTNSSNSAPPPATANSSSTTVPVFKKPVAPSQLSRVADSKPDSKSKASIEDVDMKSASSTCSMDVTNVIDLTQDIEVETLKSNVASFSKPVKETSRTPDASLPIITVQVMQDNVVDLTGGDPDGPKKQAAKQKKESEKPAVKKKTTISEDTKMRIRDSIFANMFAKQKGLGKPLDKVKKVTAAERQREREEKRKKRLERAAQKEKKKEVEEKNKNLLSEADKNLLDRWAKMQGSNPAPENCEAASLGVNDVEERKRSTSNQIISQEKSQKKSDLIRRQSLPPSFNRSQRVQMLKSRGNADVPTTRPQKMITSSNDRVVTVLLNRDEKSFQPISSAATDHVISFVPVESTSSEIKGSVPMTYSSSSGFSLPSEQFATPTTKPATFSLINGFNLTSSTVASSQLGSKPGFDSRSGTDKFIAADGGLFVPETNSTDVPTTKSDETVQKRSAMLFPSDTETRVLVGGDLLTPGKVLQQTGSLSTPRGRNLTALSPDTVDFVLNVDLQKPVTPRHIAKPPNRPSSYPSLSSAELDDLASFADPFQVATLASFRSSSFSQVQNNTSLGSNPRDRSTSCHVTAHDNVETAAFARDEAIVKKTATDSFDFPPGAFLKSFDPTMTFPGSSSQDEHQNGGVFVPHVDSVSVLSQPHGSSVMMSDALPSAGAASAVGYGLGVDITDIIPPSAGDAPGSCMDLGGDQTDSSLLADWLDVSCLCPQDMEALQRELELGSPMSIDGS